jgi:hypothetical protein
MICTWHLLLDEFRLRCMPSLLAITKPSKAEIEVPLRLTVSKFIRHGIEPLPGAQDQNLLFHNF